LEMKKISAGFLLRKLLAPQIPKFLKSGTRCGRRLPELLIQEKVSIEEDGGAESGGWGREDGRWKMEDGGRRTEEGGWRMEDGGRRTEDEGRRTEDGGRRCGAEGGEEEGGDRLRKAEGLREGRDKTS
jgi:hypothetical protein